MIKSKPFASPRNLSPHLMATLFCLLSVSCGCQTIAINDSTSGNGFAERHATPSSPEALIRSIKNTLMTPMGSSEQQPSDLQVRQKSQVQKTPLSNKFQSVYSKLFQPPKKSPEKRQPSQSDHSEQIQTARQLEQQGKLPEAIGIYESAIQNGNSSPLVLHRLAVLYDQTGRLQRAVPLYQQVLASHPNNADVLCDFGFNLYLTGNLHEAERLYRLAILASPNHARTHNNLAVLLAQSSRQQEAMNHFEIAGLDPDKAKHNMNVAIMVNQEINGVDIGGTQPVELTFSD